ncbi:MAG: helix-turn-helix domain-containing protein [Candidatus Izemoplasmataceae bacterium]
MEKVTKDYDRFRFKVRLKRHEKKLTLRELATLTNLSHSMLTRIEQGLMKPTDETMTTLSKVLDFKRQYCLECETSFDTKFNKIYEDILYARIEPTHPSAEELYENQDIYLNCDCFHRYYLIMFMYTQHLRRYKEFQDEFYQKLLLLEELFEGRDKELLYIEYAAYFINKGDRVTSIKYLDQYETFGKDQHLMAFNHQIRGIIFAENFYDYKQSLKRFELSSNTFQKLYNFTRLMQAKIMTQRILIYMNRFDDFLESYKYTYHYADINNKPFLLERAKQNMTRYHLAHRNYAEALKILNTYKSEKGEYYCFKAYALFQQKYGVEALHVIQQAKTDQFDDRYGHLWLAMDAIEYALTHSRDDEYLSRLKKFADSTFNQADFMLVKMATRLYTEALEEKRLYKEAYIYADKLLQAMKEIMK